MKRAYSVDNVLRARFNTLEFTGKWREAMGCPELTGSWFIYGPPKNGKTSFAMQLAKYLSGFRRIAYNSVEEGLSLTIQLVYKREKLREVKGKFMLLEKESMEEIIERLQRKKSPDVIVIDTIQFWELKFADYKKLKELFPSKLFIYVSHVEGRQPEGQTAKRIWRDANIVVRVEGFRAFPTGRYGGGNPIDINPDKAEEYWGLVQ